VTDMVEINNVHDIVEMNNVHGVNNVTDMV